jgi:hypothetical protein
MGIGILAPQIPVAILKGQVPPSAEFTNNYTFALAVMACKVRTVVSSGPATSSGGPTPTIDGRSWCSSPTGVGPSPRSPTPPRRGSRNSGLS